MRPGGQRGVIGDLRVDERDLTVLAVEAADQQRTAVEAPRASAPRSPGASPRAFPPSPSASPTTFVPLPSTTRLKAIVSPSGDHHSGGGVAGRQEGLGVAALGRHGRQSGLAVGDAAEAIVSPSGVQAGESSNEPAVTAGRGLPLAASMVQTAVDPGPSARTTTGCRPSGEELGRVATPVAGDRLDPAATVAVWR
jgi:hypothetical protein